MPPRTGLGAQTQPITQTPVQTAAAGASSTLQSDIATAGKLYRDATQGATVPLRPGSPEAQQIGAIINDISKKHNIPGRAVGQQVLGYQPPPPSMSLVGSLQEPPGPIDPGAEGNLRSIGPPPGLSLPQATPGPRMPMPGQLPQPNIPVGLHDVLPTPPAVVVKPPVVRRPKTPDDMAQQQLKAMVTHMADTLPPGARVPSMTDAALAEKFPEVTKVYRSKALSAAKNLAQTAPPDGDVTAALRNFSAKKTIYGVGGALGLGGLLGAAPQEAKASAPDRHTPTGRFLNLRGTNRAGDRR